MGGTCVGASVALGSAVNVGKGVLDGAGVDDGMLVAVAGKFVATTTSRRVVGDSGGSVVGAGCAHAARDSAKQKKKSERMPFALFIEIRFMCAIVTMPRKNASRNSVRNCRPLQVVLDKT